MKEKIFKNIAWLIFVLLSTSIITIKSVVAEEKADDEQTKINQERKARVDKCNKLESRFDRRVCHEWRLRYEPFVLVPHKPSYFIASWVDDLDEQNAIYDDYETKFQISFKVPLSKHKKDTKWLLFFGYTQLSVWQMFNLDHSAPFRDTNFEPELMLFRLSNFDILGMKLRLINFGLINHQSNGKSPPESRSWNRSYLELIFERGSYYLSLKGWDRWDESQKENPGDYEGDDNPDIEDYVGHAEVRLFHVGERHNVGLVHRDNFHGDGRGSTQIDWSFPVWKNKGIRLYAQYFKGYGETLIDYNIKRERFGVGLMLADWL